jgi:hypothetical protein
MSIVALIFRGANAAASLKPGRCHAARRRGQGAIFRGANAAASLKHVEHIIRPNALLDRKSGRATTWVKAVIGARARSP